MLLYRNIYSIIKLRYKILSSFNIVCVYKIIIYFLKIDFTIIKFLNLTHYVIMSLLLLSNKA